MESVLPMLAVCADVPSLIEINGKLCGEVSDSGHVAFPLSDTGDYYICAVPLRDTPEARRFAVTRKISFADGILQPPEAADVRICVWPGGAYEFFLSPGILPTPTASVFPYSISQVDWREGRRERRYSLYYESGLRLAVEEDGQIVSGYSLGDGLKGEISLLDVGSARVLIAKIAGKPEERLLAFNFEGELLLDVCAEAVGIEDGCPYTVRRCATLRRHEYRRKYDYRDGKFQAQPEEQGFFSREETFPTEENEIAAAFCEAVREGWKEEAWQYLVPELAAGLDFQEVRSFIGNFFRCRTPFSDAAGRLLGLIYKGERNVDRARLMQFEFENGRIANISER